MILHTEIIDFFPYYEFVNGTLIQNVSLAGYVPLKGAHIAPFARHTKPGSTVTLSPEKLATELRMDHD